MTLSVWREFDQLELSNSHVSLGVVPELGGKVISLRSAAGLEWLAAPVRSPSPPTAGQPFTDSDCGGWDECAPNISAGPGLADHGELWNQPWAADHRDGALRMSARGNLTPFRFTRTLRLDATSVIAEYALTNTGANQITWTWAAHTLLAIDPGTQVRLPAGTSVTRDAGPDTPIVRETEPWPIDIDGIPVDECPALDAGVAAKLYTTPAPWAALIRGDAWLLIRPDQKLVRRFGLWLNYGGYPVAEPCAEPWHHVGLEPSIGDCDDLTVAAARGTAQPTPPGATETWSFRITIGAGADSLEREAAL